METLAFIIPTLRRGMWAASLDLKDAYLHIPIAPASQRFLAFEYRGESFKFTALPFGLSTSLRVFTRVAGAVVAELRRCGILPFAYLDDWLVLWDSLEQAERQRQSCDHPSPTDRLGDQLGKVASHPYPGTGLSRGTVGLREGESFSISGKMHLPQELYLNSWRIHGAQPRVGSES